MSLRRLARQEFGVSKEVVWYAYSKSFAVGLRRAPFLAESAASRWLRFSFHVSEERHCSTARNSFFRVLRAVAEVAACPPRREKKHPHGLKHPLASHLSISSTIVYLGTTDAQTAEAVQAALMEYSRLTSHIPFWTAR
jgi:hypothetical protein